MKKIGLTGGIGSGKSLVGKILESMHYPVYYSDDRSKELVDTNPEIRSELIKLLGDSAYINNKLDREFLANKLFSDDSLRLKVNAIIHPKVRLDFIDWTSKQDSLIVFNEAAILFETGAYLGMDANILVTSPTFLKISRVMKRDNVTEKQVLDRMAKQWDDDTKAPLADYILVNDDVEPLLIQVERMLQEIESDNDN